MARTMDWMWRQLFVANFQIEFKWYDANGRLVKINRTPTDIHSHKYTYAFQIFFTHSLKYSFLSLAMVEQPCSQCARVNVFVHALLYWNLILYATATGFVQFFDWIELDQFVANARHLYVNLIWYDNRLNHKWRRKIFGI